jgi:hypothetical protein
MQLPVGLVGSERLAAFPDGSSIIVGNADGEVVFVEHEPGQQAFDLSPNVSVMFAVRLGP